jgi:hypothetical protein
MHWSNRIVLITIILVLAGSGCGPMPGGGMPAMPATKPDSVHQTPPANHGFRLLRPEPTVAALTVGEMCTTEIWLDNVQELYSVELQIEFDPQYVNIVDADPLIPGIQVNVGTPPMPNQPLINEVDNNTGLIRYKAVQPTGKSESGSGVVLSFTTQALNRGGSPLRFKVVKLQDAAGNTLPTPEYVDGLLLIDQQNGEAASCFNGAGSF